MGWASGSSLMSNIIAQLQNVLPDEDARQIAYIVMIQEFVDRDCDTLDECLGEDSAYDEAYFQLYPDRYSEYEDDD